MGANDSKPRPDGFRNQNSDPVVMPYMGTFGNGVSNSRSETRMPHTTQTPREAVAVYQAATQPERIVPTYVATRAPVETILTSIPIQQAPKLPFSEAASTAGHATPAAGVSPQRRTVPTHDAIDPLVQSETAVAAALTKRAVPTYAATSPPATEVVASPPQEQKVLTSITVDTPPLTPAAVVISQRKQTEPETGLEDTPARTPVEESYQFDYEPRSSQNNMYNNMNNYGIPPPRAPRPPQNKPWQPPQQPRSNAGAMQSQRPVTANGPRAAGFTQNRQTFQQPHQQNPRQTPNLNGSQGSRQQPQQQNKPKKPTVAEVVQSLKQILEGYDGHRFTLEGIDALYRTRKGESIPYSAIGFSSLSSFIESKCDFLTIFTGADGVTQILLRPPSYQEAVNSTTPSNPLCANLQEKHNVSNLVHDEISQTDFNRLKKISDTRARNGLTIQEFDDFHLAEFQTRIDFKGFSRTAFFRGLDDIVDMRQDRDGLKLFSKMGTQNPTKTPNKSPASQNANQKPHQSAGNKSQPSPGKKNQHPGGQNPQPGKNNKQPPKRQEQHQARQQQKVQDPRNRSQSNQREAKPRLELEPFYEKELRKMMQQCKTPEGVTFKAFKKHFKQNSSHEWRTYDRSDEEFFSGLPHIFQMIRGPNGIRLMPTPLTTGLARNNFSNWQSVSALEGPSVRTSREKVSASVGNLSATPECSMRMLMGGRCLWIVSIENYEYVPTGCVAKLANMTNDTVINELRRHSLEIRYIKRLEDQDIKKVLVNNGVARADEVVMTIPLKSVPLILRAFLGKDVDNVFMENLEEVSKEHVRNKRFGRPNRQ